ncbi:DUF2273 domain-containing protein [Microbacterium sp. Se63.02b]|uniref:DUF2273 domain-containing protein n=1 Tax=Microbacterium sp. Se63.02b TaxID=2709304 RepID=UPI0031F699EC
MSASVIGAAAAAVLALTWVALGFWAFLLVAVAMLLGAVAGRIIDGPIDVRARRGLPGPALVVMTGDGAAEAATGGVSGARPSPLGPCNDSPSASCATRQGSRSATWGCSCPTIVAHCGSRSPCRSPAGAGRRRTSSSRVTRFDGQSSTE